MVSIFVCVALASSKGSNILNVFFVNLDWLTMLECQDRLNLFFRGKYAYHHLVFYPFHERAIIPQCARALNSVKLVQCKSFRPL